MDRHDEGTCHGEGNFHGEGTRHGEEVVCHSEVTSLNGEEKAN